MTKDPVCGMMVDEKKAKFKSDYNGKAYYFCAASCKTTFDKNPSKFVGKGLMRREFCFSTSLPFFV